MKQIKFQIEIKFMDKNGKEVKVSTFASNEKELIDNTKKIMDKKRFLGLFSL